MCDITWKTPNNLSVVKLTFASHNNSDFTMTIKSINKMWDTSSFNSLYGMW